MHTCELLEPQILQLMIEIRARILDAKSKSDLQSINDELVHLVADSIVKLEQLKEIQKARHLAVVKKLD